MADPIPSTPPKNGGVLSVYRTASTVAVFDLTPALDTTISEAARGLLWRILALSKKHGDSWAIWLQDIAQEGVDTFDDLKAMMNELRDAGYVRRFKLNRENGTFWWYTQAAELPIFENDQVKPEFQAWVQAPEPVKRIRKSRTEKPKKAVLRGYHETMKWWTSPVEEGGRGQAVPRAQYGRLGKRTNELLEIAHTRGWITDDSDLEDYFGILEDCLAWIADSKFRGEQTMENLIKRVQLWYDAERTIQAATSGLYVPISIQ